MPFQAQERYVYSMVWPEKVQKKDISWLPREQTLSMRNHFEEEEEELSQVLLMGSGADFFFHFYCHYHYHYYDSVGIPT